MKYFLDTEFLEGSQKTFFGKSKPTIDLISIGIVDENGKEYYAISKDFNLKEAWNRCDLKEANTSENHSLNDIRIYWIRKNVLKPIFKDLWFEKGHLQNLHNISNDFTFSNFKKLINLYGKTNSQIAKEVKTFVQRSEISSFNINDPKQFKPSFYGYFADYDWVVFCWLFGKMIDLPDGFPMYCNDLKQMSDDVYNEKKKAYTLKGGNNFLLDLKKHPEYPKQYNEHNALDDAKWNLELFKFLQGVS